MGRKDPTAFKQRFEAYKNGKPVKEIYDAGYIKEPVITPDPQYNEYINSLPDNQRLSPESSYRSRRYWELNDKPKNFGEAVGKGMFEYNFEDNSWHASSAALNKKTGEYEFMKPNWHSTKMWEDAWYYSKDGEQFRSQYTRKPGVAYDKYVPKYCNGKLPKYGDGTIPYTSSDGSSYNINSNVVGSEQLNITVPEVVVTGNDKRPMYQRYDAYNSTYYPENIEKGFNAFTLGGLNNLSPTQWARRFYDAPKLFSGSMSFKDYTDRWINGNEGIVSANFQKHNPISSFIINGIGDAVLLGIGTQGGRITHNIANRNQFFYRDMAPYTYDKPYKKALKAAKSILTEEKINLPDNYTPQWMNNTDGAGTIGYLGPVRKDIVDASIADPMGEGIKQFDTYAKNQILLQNRFRDAAYRKYLGLPEKEPVYIKNPTNDTYSYNLPYIKKLYNEYGVSPNTYAMRQNADWLTSNAGGLEKSEIIPFGHGISTDIDKSYSVQHMIDTWDLHPFRRVENQILPKYTKFMQNAANKIYTNLYDRVYKNPKAYKYLGGRYLNKVRYDDQSVPFKNLIQKISKKAQDFEAGPILGGKPFVMDSWVPLTRKYDYAHGANIIETVGLDAQNILPQQYFDWLKTQNFPSSMYTLTIK